MLKRLKEVKETGIMPGKLRVKDVTVSFSQFNNSKDMLEQTKTSSFKQKSDNVFDFLVISQQNTFYQAWSIIHTLSCLTSSYFYAYMAAFGQPIKGTSIYRLDWVYEVIFYISLGLNFIVDYTPEGSNKPVRDLKEIGKRYLKNGFWMDFLPIIPFVQIFDFNGREKHLYSIKILRLVAGFKILNVGKIMEKIKGLQKKKIAKAIEEQQGFEDEEQNLLSDQNDISLLIFTNYALRIFKLVIIIGNFSYFLGFLFYVYCDISLEIAVNNGVNLDENEFFIQYFSIKDYTDIQKSILLVYYAFTTLSTVGFGDFSPRSDSERVFVSFILIFGVAIFSYIMGIFIEILQSYQELSAELDEGDQLSKFFGLIRNFNN